VLDFMLCEFTKNPVYGPDQLQSIVDMHWHQRKQKAFAGAILLTAAAGSQPCRQQQPDN